MLKPTPVYKKARFWRRLIPMAILFFWFIWLLPDLRQAVLWFLGANPMTGDALRNMEIRRGVLVTFINCIGLPLFFILGVALVSQFVLPVRTWEERRNVFARLFMYFFNSHGPAVFIQEGKEVANPEELKNSRPGVALVDLTSAIVLERQPFISDMAEDDGNPDSESRPSYFAYQQRGIFRRSIYGMVGGVIEREKGKEQEIARASGPGIVFTQYGEKVRGVVSLRRQFRVQPFTTAMSRDGFEVFGHVICIFSLSEPPDVLKVGYPIEFSGDLQASQLRVVNVDAQGKITGFSDELDDDDKQEIHQFARRYRQPVEPVAEEDNKNKKSKKKKEPSYSVPYPFDPDRVFRAVYADTRLAKENKIESWLDLPSKVAVETFRNMVALENYADLYKPKDPKDFPLLQRLKPAFSKKVRNQGVLSYRFARPWGERRLAVGQMWNEEQLEILPVTALRTSKVLRDRGIRVIAGSFPELRPANPLVRKVLFEHWRAPWQKDTEKTLAVYDYEQIRVRADARIKIQKQIAQSLSFILDDQSVSQDAVALRLLASLESFASEKTTNLLVPHEVVNLLTDMRQWMSSGEQSSATAPEQDNSLLPF